MVLNRTAFYWLFILLCYSSEAFPHCLNDVQLIPPYERVILETAFTKINYWAIDLLQKAVRCADEAFKDSKDFSDRNKSCDNFRGDLSLGALPTARFLLSALGLWNLFFVFLFLLCAVFSNVYAHCAVIAASWSILKWWSAFLNKKRATQWNV